MATPTQHAAAVAAAIAAYVASPNQTTLAAALATAFNAYDGDIGGLTNLAGNLMDQVNTTLETIGLFRVTGEVDLVDDLPDEAATGEFWMVTTGSMADHGFLRSGSRWVDLFSALQGPQGQGLRTWVTIAGPYTAINGDRLVCDSSAGAFTVHLPSQGGEVWLRDLSGSFGVHAVTVNGNGRTISGDATLICDAAGYEVHLTSRGATWDFRMTFVYGGDA